MFLLLKSNRYIELYPLLIIFFIFFITLICHKKNFFFNSFIFPTLNKKPLYHLKEFLLDLLGNLKILLFFLSIVPQAIHLAILQILKII